MITQPVVYSDLAQAFVIRLLVRLLKNLHQNGIVDDNDILTQSSKADTILFQLAFGLLAQFEDQGGFVFKGTRFYAHGLLSTSLNNPTEFFDQVSRTDLHGHVDESEIAAAFAQVAMEISASSSSLKPGQ